MDDDDGGGDLDGGAVGAGGDGWKGGVREVGRGGGGEKLSFPNSSLIFRG